MRQIDVPSASPNLPQPSAAGAPGYFTDGDPVSGTPATVVPAEWLNMVMMELVNVILGAGLAPSKTDFTQVAKAVASFGTKSVTLAANGHVEFANGLIVNWGSGAHGDTTGAQLVTFEKPFANGCFASFATNNAGGPPAAFHGTGNATKIGMTVYSAQSSAAAAGQGTAFYWLAIGR